MNDEPGQAAKPAAVKIAPKVVQRPISGWEFPREVPDRLLMSLVEALRLMGRDLGPEQLVSGQSLPADGRFTPRIALETAERQGFRARLIRRGLADLPSGVLPAIAFLAGRDACVIVALRDDDVDLIWPARSSHPITLPRQQLADVYEGHVLLLRPDVAAEQSETAAASGKHWYWATAARFWPEYLQVMLASVLVNLLALAVPLFTKIIYDRVFPNAALVTMWSLVAGVGLALVFDALLKWLRSTAIDRASRQVDEAVSSAIFRHVADLRLESRTMAAGTLMNTLKDYEQVRDFFSSQTLATMVDLCFAVVFIAAIYVIGGPLALPPLIALTLVLIMGVAILWPLRNASNRSRQTMGQKNAVAVEAITELEGLKAVAGQGRMQSRWERNVADNARAQEKSRSLAVFVTTFTALMQQLSTIAIVIIGVYLALDGQVTMGTVIAASILSGRTMAPTATLAQLFVRASFAFSTLRSLNQIMALPSDSRPVGKQINTTIERGGFSLQSVALQYPGTQVPSLKDVTLSVAANERVGLIGPVGSGKTSLVRVMAGLYAPTAGMVLIDELNISQLHAAQVRRAVQLVPQEAVLFSGTLAENIAFGDPHATGEDVLHAARLSGVDRIAARNPLGFAMPIAERGRNLSGGQRQMVALARALLARPRVLILDEPTSSMDTQSERLFVQSLARALAERPMTLIVSTHRTGLLEVVDRLVLLDDGKVVRDGPKRDVMAFLTGQERKA